MIYIILATAAGRIRDGFRRLTFGADKQDPAATGGNIAQRAQCLMQHGNRLLQIENVYAVAHAENIGAHFWVPATGLMAEMNAGFQKLAHGELWQSHVNSFSGYASAELVRSNAPNTGAANALSRRAPHIRVRDARAQARVRVKYAWRAQ